MVTTRRKRRAAEAASSAATTSSSTSTTTTTTTDGDGDPLLLLDVKEAENQLEAAEAMRLRRAKKKKKESFERHHPPLSMIPKEIWTNHILTFVDDPRIIYNMAIMSGAKFLYSAMTPTIIIRSIVFGGGKPKQALEDIMEMVENHLIHPPSKFRLLRLALAQRCEMGTNCYGYNLVQHKSASIAKDSGRRPFGMAICQACANSLSAQAYNPGIYGGGYELNELSFLCNKMPTHPVKEVGTGDSIGPWMLCRTVKQVTVSYDSDKQVEVLKGMKDNFLKSIDQEYVESILQIHSDATDEYPDFVEAKRKLKEDKAQAKKDQRYSKKKASVQNILDQLKDCMEEWDFEHKDRILSGSFSFDGYYELTEGPSKAIFGTLLSAPSNASKKKIHDACDKAMDVFPWLFENNFLVVVEPVGEQHEDDEFLADFPAGRDIPAVQALLEYAKAKGVNEMMRNVSFNYDKFVQAAVDERLKYALLRLIPEDQLEQVFARYEVKNEQPIFKDRMFRLAENVWRSKANAFRNNNNNNNNSSYRHDMSPYDNPINCTFTEYLICFRNTAHLGFCDLRRNFKRFLEHPATVTFLADTSPEGPWVMYSSIATREDAINLALDCKGDLLDHLRLRRFDRMLVLCRRAFNSGRRIYYDD